MHYFCITSLVEGKTLAEMHYTPSKFSKSYSFMVFSDAVTSRTGQVYFTRTRESAAGQL